MLYLNWTKSKRLPLTIYSLHSEGVDWLVNLRDSVVFLSAVSRVLGCFPLIIWFMFLFSAINSSYMFIQTFSGNELIQFEPNFHARFFSAACLTCGHEGVKGVDVSTLGTYSNQSQSNTQGHRGGASADFPQVFSSLKVSAFFSWAVCRCVSTVSPWWQLKHTRARI